jgi:hypothetical protein
VVDRTLRIYGSKKIRVIWRKPEKYLVIDEMPSWSVSILSVRSK